MKHMSLNNGVGHKDSNHNLVSNGAISSVTQSSGDQLVVDHRQVPPRLPIPNNGDRVFITYVKDPLDFRASILFVFFCIVFGLVIQHYTTFEFVAEV